MVKPLPISPEGTSEVCISLRKSPRIRPWIESPGLDFSGSRPYDQT